MNTTKPQTQELLSSYLIPLSKLGELLANKDPHDVKRYRRQARNFDTYIGNLLHNPVREFSYEKYKQEPTLIKTIRQFIFQVEEVITEGMLGELSAKMRIYILEYFQAIAIQHHLSSIEITSPVLGSGQYAFFHRVKRREAIGESKLQMMLRIKSMSNDEVATWFKALLVAELDHFIASPTSLTRPSLDQTIQNLIAIAVDVEKSNQNIEEKIRQQLTQLDEVNYFVYKMTAYNRFILTGSSLFLAAEVALRDERLKSIPGNVPLDPAFINFFSTVTGLLYLYSAVSQFGVLGAVFLSALTQMTSDLELATWVGAKINQSPESTLQTISNIGYGFSLKDISQFGIIIAQVVMELGDEDNATILRAIAGSILVFTLAGVVTGYLTGRIDQSQNTKLTPIISICSFFSATRLFSFGLNKVSTMLSLLYQTYDAHYGYWTPEEIMMEPNLCRARPEACKSAALNFFDLPAGGTTREIKNAYKKMTASCHPDTSSGDTDCLMKVRAAMGVLKS